jgi:hypothetical protein
MKKEISPLPSYYVPSPLKITEINNKEGALLKVVKRKESVSKQRVSIITNNSIHDPATWDASWYRNYE